MTAGLAVQLGRLRLPNPVLVAAGTFGYGVEFRHAVRLDQLGGLVTKTITVQPRAGHPAPRLAETPSGMLNAVGLQNVGIEAFVSEKLPEIGRLGVPVIVSVLGESLEDVRALCARLDPQPAVSAIELNLSCPNLHQTSDIRHQTSETRGAESAKMAAQDPEATRAFVQAARKATSKPLIAKLSPDVTDIRVIAQAAEAAGADALSIGNTFTGMSLDPHTRRSRLGTLTGGLSGPAIRPLAVYRVWAVSQAVRCPVIGIGGIVRAEDAIEFFLAGATAVALGSANFANPAAALAVVKGLQRHLRREGHSSMQDLIGKLEHAEGR
jgi:dihydroorotate dehydrogenase (NAD+) catalytic subunit